MSTTIAVIIEVELDPPNDPMTSSIGSHVDNMVNELSQWDHVVSVDWKYKPIVKMIEPDYD